MTIRPALSALAAMVMIRSALRALAAMMIMTVMVTLPALLGVQAWAAGPAEDHEKSERIRQLLRINGFEFQISKAPETLAVQLGSLKERSGLNQDDHAFVVEVIIEAFDPAGILNRVVANMAETGDQIWLRDTLAFLATPLGKRMTQLEKDASGAESYRAMTKWGESLRDNPPPKSRIQLIHQVNSAGKVFESSLDTAVNMSMAMALALEAAKPGKHLWDEDQYREAKARVRGALTERMRNIVFLRLLYTYRQASDGEIKSYIRFYQGKAGKKYVTLMNEAVGKAIIALTWEAAKKIKVKSRL
ncbi:MAG: hypothetical protein V3S64_07080 [bacterium]